MSDALTGKEQEGDVETALLDADLFIKYHAPERAVRRLRTALERFPRSMQLRERLREISTAKHPEEAARQCLALASLYIEREELQTAYDRLLEAKTLDPRISIAPGLEAIRRTRHPAAQQTAPAPAQHSFRKPYSALAGDLSSVSIFDAIQVLENSRLTGTLSIVSAVLEGHVNFNEGLIVDAEIAQTSGVDAFRRLLELNSGTFEFEKSETAFPIGIHATSNTNLILDSLRQLDEAKK
jgi:hypothetical protein